MILKPKQDFYFWLLRNNWVQINPCCNKLENWTKYMGKTLDRDSAEPDC